MFNPLFFQKFCFFFTLILISLLRIFHHGNRVGLTWNLWTKLNFKKWLKKKKKNDFIEVFQPRHFSSDSVKHNWFFWWENNQIHIKKPLNSIFERILSFTFAFWEHSIVHFFQSFLGCLQDDCPFFRPPFCSK